jgi:3-oxoacyl-[acyl-carrier-protein] synthase II
MKKKKVVVTGMGVINSICVGVDQFTDALKTGKCGFREIKTFNVSDSEYKIGAEIEDFNLEYFFDSKKSRRLDRASILTLIAAREAFESAGLHKCKLNNWRCGVIAGSTLGGMKTGLNYYKDKSLNKKVNPYRLAEYPLNRAGLHIAEEFGLKGPNMTVSTACSSGSMVLGYACDMIRSGYIDCVLAGGFEAFSELAWAGFGSLKNMAKTVCRPFDKNRDGLILGEGAGFVLLESIESAKNRNAPTFAEIKGFGATSDAYQMTAPQPVGKGAAAAITKALVDAEFSLDQIDYINAHGTGTPLNDSMEVNALKAVFGSRLENIPVSSTKSMIGHTLGAAGTVEFIASIASLRDGFLPPTMNYSTPDPSCSIDCIPTTPRFKTAVNFLSNSFGFGGNNCCIVATIL